MINLQNFQPGQYITIATTTTAVNGTIAIAASGSTNSTPLYDARIVNAGTSVTFVSWGGTGVTATSTTGVAILPSAAPEKFNMGASSNVFSAINALGTGSVYIAIGNGA